MSYVYPPQQPVVIFERVSPRYDASLALAYRGRRLLYPRSEIRLYSTSTESAIFTEDDELLANATETILYTGFNSAAVKDRDDDTYAHAVDDVAPGETRDLVKWDLGLVTTGYIVVKHGGAASEAYTRVLASSDDVEYTVLSETVGSATVVRVIKTAFRYLKLQVYNGATSVHPATVYKFYTVEVYPENKKKNILRNTSPNPVSKLINIITAGYSSVLEVIWL
jgi:hypothetical protein